MRVSVAASLLCLGLICCLAKETEHVLTINGDAEFEKAVKDSNFLVAEFYAPWCGHCKTLAPEYEKAAKTLKDNKSSAVLAKIDATEEANKALASKYGVQGFPTLKIFRNGMIDSPAEYGGPRDAPGIVAYVEKASGPPSKEMKTAAEVEEHKQKDPAVIGVFKSDADKAFKAYELAAGGLWSDYDFAHTFDASLVEEAKGAPALIIVKTYDEPVVIYDGEFKHDPIVEFIEEKTAPVLVEMDQAPKNKKALSRIFADNSKPKILAMIPESNKKVEDFRKVLTKITKERKESFNVLWADPKTSPQVPKYFGLEDSDLPAIAIHEGTNDGKYFFKNAAVKKVEKWLDDFQAGKVPKFIKSEETPKDNSGPVSVVTANTFEEIVFGGKDVLIEFYAPWCGHCKSLAPIYDQLGEKYKDNDSVVIAKMDATANDVPSSKFSVSGFPTIAWVDGKGGDVSVYSGDRSLEDLTTFVKLKSKYRDGAEAAETAEEPAKDEL